MIESDRILVLDKGRVVEDGAYQITMARNGVYQPLMAEQGKSHVIDGPIDQAARGRPLRPVDVVDTGA